MTSTQILEGIMAARARRAAEMPTDYDCLRQMIICHERLRDLGWRDAIYCPKDGTVFEAIEFGSTGIHDCHYEGNWPNGEWLVHDMGDLMPSRPVMFRPKSSSRT